MKDINETKHNKHLNKYHDIHKGKTGIIYACGPSLNQFDISKLSLDVEDTIHIAMKLSILSSNVPKIDYYFFGDKNDKSKLYERLLIEKTFVKFGLVLCDNIEHPFCYSLDFCKKCNAEPVEVSYKAGFQPDISKYPCYKSTTLFPALQFSLYSGLKNIYVVGLDATQDSSYITKLEHTFKARKANLKQKLNDHIKKFNAYKKRFYDDRRIYHVNPVDIKLFDKVIKI